jgi:hypothetical protein
MKNVSESLASTIRQGFTEVVEAVRLAFKT